MDGAGSMYEPRRGQSQPGGVERWGSQFAEVAPRGRPSRDMKLIRDELSF